MRMSRPRRSTRSNKRVAIRDGADEQTPSHPPRDTQALPHLVRRASTSAGATCACRQWRKRRNQRPDDNSMLDGGSTKSSRRTAAQPPPV
uniref:Uncharacterized protein n=1 Tax=Mycena chlorophos TaxID=658473 RepID=A0ABQ0LBF4_MYCCL|nr:predicted protein [Mycena chlorophos]